MRELLFVDGYNIIGAWEEAEKNQWPIDECRDRLAHLLEEYAALKALHVVLVFDGYNTPRLFSSVEHKKHIQIVFTKSGETADAYIEKAVFQAPKMQRIWVATSDALQQYSILGDGAGRISARELLLSLGASKKQTAQQTHTRSRNNLSDQLPPTVLAKLQAMVKENNQK